MCIRDSYVKVYNQHVPQKALGHIPPLQAMKNRSQKQPQLLKKCVYNLTGLDKPPNNPGLRPDRYGVEHGVTQSDARIRFNQYSF